MGYKDNIRKITWLAGNQYVLKNDVYNLLTTARQFPKNDRKTLGTVRAGVRHLRCTHGYQRLLDELEGLNEHLGLRPCYEDIARFISQHRKKI